MIGAHFDSWHTGTGATDNAVSSAVMMEAMRILQTSGLKPRRTIRMALWTGEEQGLLGSRAYVKEHFADPTDMKLKPEHGKLSVYLNMDNGGGAFRGVYLQGNEAAAPVFEAWMKPFRNFGMQTLTIRNTGGTDHQAFDCRRPAGIPVHPGSARVLVAHAPHEPGRLRARHSAGPDAERDRRRVVCLPGREPRRAVPAQAAAQGASGRAGRTGWARPNRTGDAPHDDDEPAVAGHRAPERSGTGFRVPLPYVAVELARRSPTD